MPSEEQAMSLYGVIHDFLHHLGMNGYAPATVKNLHYHLRAFSVYLKSRGVDEVGAVTPVLLREYQAEMFWRLSKRGRPYSLLTRCSRLCALKAFFHHVVTRRVIMTDPTGCITAQKPDSLPRTILSIHEVEALLSQPGMKSFAGKRDRAILEILYSTAVRHKELSGLALYDVDLSGGTLSIRQGKGRKDRVVPLGKGASLYVESYLEARAKVPCRDHALFVTSRGMALDYHTYNPVVRKYAVRAGIEKPVTCHVLRHTCAVHMLEGGADVRSIQELLGHESIESTQIYLRVSPVELKKVHRQTHPRGKVPPHGE